MNSLDSLVIRWLILLLALASTVAPAWPAPAILVFGDSLSAAYGLPREAGWVQLLEKELRERGYPHQVVNASISGETTLGGRNRITAALKGHAPQIVIVELGANDGLRGLSLESTRDNLEAIIEAARRAGAQVLLVGMRLPPNYGMAYTEKFQALYAELARRHKLKLVPFLLQGFAEQRQYFQPDAVHPTAEAQPLILENIWRELEPMLKKGPRAAL
jgi:acyl-CoA thioesterase I